jgi:hypothetical protein
MFFGRIMNTTFRLFVAAALSNPTIFFAFNGFKLLYRRSDVESWDGI